MMPIAMCFGAVFYKFFGMLSVLTPYLIFCMLFLTYCSMKMKDVKLTWLHFWLLLIQFGGSLGVYFLIVPFNELLAQGAMVCVMASTGTAAPVVTGMLKGDVASVTAYSLASNLLLALLAPVVFSFIGTNRSLPFLDSFRAISEQVMVLLLSPFLLALVLRKFIPVVTDKIGSYSGLAFYLWSLALCIVTGRTVEFILKQSAANHLMEVLIGIAAAVVCIGQFLSGRAIGKLYNNTIAGGQSLGQKNTILAIWMAQMFLNPIASIGPGAYVLWQNMVNSYQVWLKRKSL